MSKYIIFNCPAYKGFTKDIPDWLNNTNCGQYAGQVPCQDCTDCVMKQIVSRLNNFAEDYGLDAGFYADELLSYLDIQEVE